MAKRKKSPKRYVVFCRGIIRHSGHKKKSHAQRMARELRAYEKGCTVRKVSVAFLKRKGW